jgi:Holliday junction resolvasome RuvABC endonuclease subunit
VPNVIGLDLSLTSTGIAVEEVTVLQTKLRGMGRLAWLRDQIRAAIAAVDDPAVVVEGYSFGSRNSQSHAAGELGGVIRLALWEASIPYVDVPPTCRAKFATGRGNASKSEVVSAVSARTGLIWSGKGADDCCDAWILREMGRVRLGQEEFSWPAINLTALDKVDWAPLTGV